MNAAENEGKRPRHPMESASLLSRATLWLVSVTIKLALNRFRNILSCCTRRWLKDLIRLGMKRPIDEDDIYESLESLDSKRSTDEFSKVWQEEKKTRRQPSLLRALWRIYGNRILWPSIIYTILDASIR